VPLDRLRDCIRRLALSLSLEAHFFTPLALLSKKRVLPAIHEQQPLSLPIGQRQTDPLELQRCRIQGWAINRAGAGLFCARRPGVSKSAIKRHVAYTDEESAIFQKSSP